MGILKKADDRSLREKMYIAYCTRASEFSEGDLKDNLPLMEKFRKL